MFTFIFRRVLQLPLILFGISILIFGLTQFLSADIRAASFAQSEKQAQPAFIAGIIERYHLDADFFTQYRIWLSEVFQGNLGYSRTAHLPVLEALAIKVPATMELALVAIVVIALFGITIGILTAVTRNSWFDHTIRVLSIIAYGFPSFVVGIFVITVFYGILQWFEPGRINTILSLTAGLPTTDGFLFFPSLFAGKWDIVVDLIKHLFMPVLTLTFVISPQLIQVVRSNVIDVLRQDYVRTAKAKGLTSRSIVVKHALRNALIPVVTVLGTILIGLLSGSIITETIFTYPGVGLWASQAAQTIDIPSVIGFAMFAATTVTVINLMVDVLYGIIDPRIRYE